MKGRKGKARIGNRRRDCKTCNKFVANVKRITAKKLQLNHPEEWARLRQSVEADLYPQIIEEFSQRMMLP